MASARDSEHFSARSRFVPDAASDPREVFHMSGNRKSLNTDRTCQWDRQEGAAFAYPRRLLYGLVCRAVVLRVRGARALELGANPSALLKVSRSRDEAIASRATAPSGAVEGCHSSVEPLLRRRSARHRTLPR
jgi:hypothetical protein